MAIYRLPINSLLVTSNCYWHGYRLKLKSMWFEKMWFKRLNPVDMSLVRNLPAKISFDDVNTWLTDGIPPPNPLECSMCTFHTWNAHWYHGYNANSSLPQRSRRPYTDAKANILTFFECQRIWCLLYKLYVNYVDTVSANVQWEQPPNEWMMEFQLWNYLHAQRPLRKYLGKSDGHETAFGLPNVNSLIPCIPLGFLWGLTNWNQNFERPILANANWINNFR